MKRFIYILVTTILIAGACSCADNSDNFSSDSSLKLTFSKDTVSFDTVFTTIGSATRNFRIYNRNNKSLTIESIEIMNPSKSGFRMNVDGESGIKLASVDILKKDSLYGFLEVTVNPLNVNSPVLIRDSIRFITNGNIQYLYIEAVGRDVYIWDKKMLAKDTVITSQKPILVYNELTINEGTTVTIKENTELYFHDKASVQVYGRILAQGKVGKPIVFRGDRLDYINGPIPYDYASGLWGGITFYEKSYENILENVVVRNAVNGLTFLPSDTQSKKAILRNCIVHNSSENGISATSCEIEAVNCLFSNARNTLLSLKKGKYSFLHCTIANYYRWSGRINRSIAMTETAQCDFVNTIIYGSMQSELELPAEGSSANYKFINCLIRNKDQFNNTHFVNVQWSIDPQFLYLNDNGYFHYDFRIKKDSPAIDQADRTYSVAAPLDINGKSRLDDINPDLGCYEWESE